MKIFKREISFLLIIALVVSSFFIGFGTIKVNAVDQATGQYATYRFRVKTSGQDCLGTGTPNNLNVTINYTDATSATSNTIAGESSPNWFEAGNTDILVLSPAMPAKPISSISFNSIGGDRWKIDWAYIDYSYDGGINWAQIAGMGGFDGTGIRTFSLSSTYSLNNSSLNKTLTFDANGGTGGKQIYSEWGATLPASNVPAVTRTGYTFAGWSPAVPANGPSADTTYTAQWTPNNINITFDANGGTGGTGPTSMQVGSSLTPPTVARTGYTFLNWLPEVPATVPVIDTAYTAQWAENPTITFNSNGGSEVDAIISAYNASVLRPADPVKDGYNFGEWFLEPEFITPVQWPFTVTHDANLYARWNPENQYTIVFNANGGTGGTCAVWLAGDSLTAPAVEKTGYTLAGWSPALPEFVPEDNTIYTAQWAANTYTVSYTGNGNDAGSTLNSLHTYDIASTLTANGFTRIGHSFLGWSTNQSATAASYTNGESVLNLTPNQSEVITFYAVWSANYYTITFNANGGTGDTTNSRQFGTILSAPTVIRTGYTFAGWSPEVPFTVPAAHSIYTAQWTANQYLVTFDPQGGSVSPTSSTVTYRSTYGAGTGGIPTPTRTNYTFGGWYTGTNGSGSNILSTTTVSTALNHTLYAKWTGITYTVVYNGNGSTGGSTSNSSHKYGTAKTLTANGYTNTGYAFVGWATSADGDVVYSDKQIVLNLTETGGATVTLYAKWTNINVATITFDANGGTGGMSTTLIIGAPLFAPTVVKNGYTFVSWSPTLPATVPAADTTYTAQWTGITSIVTFNPMGGTVSPMSSTVTYNSTYGEGTGGFPTPVRTGYTFDGWYFNSGGTGTQVLSTSTVTIMIATTFYAKWTAYTINQATGQLAYYRFRVRTANQDDGNTGTANNLNVTINYSDGTSATSDTIPGESSSYLNYFEAGNTDTIVLSPQLPAKPISSITFNSIGVDRWKTDWTALDYSYDNGSNYRQIATTGGFDYQSGVRTMTYPSDYSLNTGAANSFNKILTFSANGGTGGKEIYSEQGATLPASNIPTVTRTGYTFAGWSPAVPTTGPSANTTYTAQWTPINVNITFDANGGTGGTGPTAMTPGNALTAPTVSRTGYTFTGWSPAVPPVVPDVNTTYTAQWTPEVTDNIAVDIDLEVGRYSGGVFTPLAPGEALRTNDIITVRIAPTSDFLCGTTRYVVMFSKNYFQAVGSGKAAFTPNTANAFYATACSGYSGATSIPQTAWPAAMVTDGSYAANSAIAVNNSSSSAAPNGGYPGYLPGTWLFRFDLKVTQDIIPGSGAKVWMDNRWLRKPGYATGSMYFYKCLDPAKKSTVGSSTLYNFNLDISGANISLEPDLDVNIAFDANGGTGGTSATMTYGTVLTPPVVSKPGYLFAGWSPSVPATVPAHDTAYTAQYYPIPAVQVTKLADGFKVNIKDWVADYKYQIWSYQKITSDLFSGETASQWVLSKAYTPGSGGTAEADGSISFVIAGFTSPDSNYTVAVRIADANNSYVSEVRDTYTPEDVQEVKITKVLVDGEYSEGMVLKAHDASSPIVFTVIGNNVPGTVYTARVSETGERLAASNTINFSWDTSVLATGMYTVQFTGSNGATTDTKNILVQLYTLNSSIQYGTISNLGLSAAENSTLPKTMAIDPDFTNGSFYYRVGEPGRKAVFTSGLFQPADSIEYTFTKYGIYQVAGFVNREYEVKIGNNYDDGFMKQFTVSRSQTEPSSVALTANADITKPIDKATPLLFTASANIGGIGTTPVEYSFWRYDAKGYALVKDWSSDNTLVWTPARVGNYTIHVRAKGADAGSYEATQSVKVTVTDSTDQIAQGVVITLNEAELNANATARAPITIKANATSTNSEDLLYKFNIGDSAMGINTEQNYSVDSNCIWTPRKAGVYTISVLVKNNASYGAYDAMETFEITVS